MIGQATNAWTTLKIYPTTSGLSITGNLAAPLIDLNGADNVTIDGRVNQTGNPDLTISNTNTSTTAGTSTIRFIDDASTNTVKYCTIKGSEMVINTPSAGSGTLFFSTGTSTGNITNTITDNTITSAGANLPFNAIYSYGTAAKENSGISITNNNIQDYSGASPNGIYLASYSSAWTITGNRFFQTATRYITGIQRDINIVTAGGGGYVINNNIIGYSSALGTGTSTFTGTANLIPIELTAAASPASEIQGNTISAISFSTSNATNAGSGIFSGISVLAGTVNVGTTTANTIGAETGNGAITITPSSGTPFIQGIYATSTGTVGIQNNKIGGISVNGAATIGFTFFGIKTAGTAGNFTISGNTIGSTSTTNSIAVGTNGTTTTGVCGFFGISQAATGTVSITGNTIQNCSAYGTAGSTFYGISNTGSTGTTAISTNNILNGTLTGIEKLLGIFNSALPTTLNISTNTISTLATASSLIATGISSTGAATTTTINGNIINTISSTGASCVISGIKSTAGTTVNIYSNTINALSGSGATSPIVSGINIGGGTTVNMHKNNIYNLSQSGAIATTAGAVNGMLISAGTTVYAYNNFISELKAPAANIDDAVRGISITSTTSSSTYRVYNNSVYLDASSSGANFGSSGIYHSTNGTATTAAIDLRNNIIVNNSTPKGSGYTVANRRSDSTITNFASTSNYNNYYAGSPGTYNVIYFDGTSSKQTLTDYKAFVTSREVNSVTELPPFVNVSTSPYDLRISTSSATLCEGRGSVISTPSITDDYFGTARYPNSGYPNNPSYSVTAPDIGAQEFGGIPTGNGTIYVGTDQTITSLTNANGLFDYINNSSLTGNLTVLITTNLSSETGTIALNQWAGTNTLTISPTGGAARTISGTYNGALISLNGADNVTIDGLNTGGNSLIISNTSTGSLASTIKFSNDATYNTVKNSTITGSTLNTVGGVIFFSTTTGTLGNSNNTIDYNNITCAADANRPLNAVYSVGTATYLNASNTISNNNIYNFLSRSTASNGINLAANNSAWTVSGNNFYETASFIPTASIIYNVIYIVNTGVNYSISNNYIGGAAADHSGIWTKTNAFDNIFYSIYVNAGTSTASNIQGNTINNISWSNSGSSLFCGIGVWGGNVNVGTSSGNTIGAATGTGTLTFTGGASAIFYGIYLNSTSTVNASNNTVGSITTSNAATSGTNTYGIFTTSSGTFTINSNLIGSTSTVNSINASSTSTGNGQSVIGIFNSLSVGAVSSISGNTIANLKNGATNSNTGTNTFGIKVLAGTNTVSNNIIHDLTASDINAGASGNASIQGISFNTSTAQNISGNTIFNLSNTNSSFAGHIIGLLYAGNATSTVTGNFIHDFSAPNTSSTTTNFYGIQIVTGSTTYANNIISLGGNTKTHIYGIYDPGIVNYNTNLYFNTVYISGTLASGSTAQSYALKCNSNANNRNYRNNILVNTRSTSGGSNLHAAIGFMATGGTLTCDYNDYIASGTGSFLGLYSGLVTAVPIVTGQDAHSLNTTPSFASAGGSTALSYLPSATLAGIDGTGITTDYAGSTRAATPTMGAFELPPSAVNWTGTTSTDWNTPGNWSPANVPFTTTAVTIPNVTNDPVVNQAPGTPAICNNLTIQTGAVLSIAPGKALTVNGSLTNSAGTGGLIIQSNASGTGSLIHNSDAVNATLQRYITGSSTLTDMKYHFVSVPLVTATASTSNMFLNSYLFDYTQSSGAWNALGSATTNTLDETRGYMIYYPGTSNTYSFAGQLNNGAFTALTSYTSGQGYNLVPNPYPSAIDWDASSGWTKTNIAGTLYYWPAGAAAVSSNYAYWNGSAGVNSGTRYVPAGQAFFVQATGSSPVLTMTNATRVHNAQAFWKEGERIQNLLRIKAVSIHNQAFDELLIHFREGATANFDSDFDANKLQGGEDAPQISSVAMDNSKLSINSLPFSGSDVIVPLAFGLNAGTDVTLTASGMESFYESIPIYLEDLTTNTVTDLRVNPVYTFSHAAGDNENRFQLRFKGVTGTHEQPLTSPGNVFVSQGQLFVDVPSMQQLPASLAVYDALGRQFSSFKVILNGIMQYAAPSIPGVYVVRIIGGNKSFTGKVVVGE